MFQNCFKISKHSLEMSFYLTVSVKIQLSFTVLPIILEIIHHTDEGNNKIIVFIFIQ